MNSTIKKRIGILRGGAGKHYASSLKKGGEIILFISENLADKYKPIDILVDRDYLWHINGAPINPADLIHKVDLVWNTAHPSFSNILESLSIPNISAGSFYSALENDKDLLREHIKSIGLQIPRHIISPKNAREVFEKFSSPWIVKSFNDESKINMQLVKTFPDLVSLIENKTHAEAGQESISVEEFIAGKMASVHSVPKFRNEEIYIFPLGNSFGNFSGEEKQKLTSLVKTLHQHIGAGHYLKSDFILTPHGKFYLLQIEGMPDLKQDSHFSQVVESIGAKTRDVVEHILENVFKN